MKNKPLFNKEISQKQNNQISHKTKESEDDTGDESPNTSDFGI